MFNQPFWLGHREFPPEYVIKKPNQIGNTNKPNCIVTYSFQPHFPTNETNEFLVFLQSFRRTDGSLDSRMNHLGCPVLYGDKWIGNKWVRWQEQVLLIWGFSFSTAADIPSFSSHCWDSYFQVSTFKCFLPKGVNYRSNDSVFTKKGRWNIYKSWRNSLLDMFEKTLQK